IRFFLMMVWSLFIIGLMGLFFYNKIGSIIPMVVLPTTEIIEPKFFILGVRTVSSVLAPFLFDKSVWWRILNENQRAK
ncbi:hypothetical protein, partial [Streptococcus infantis]|uniref:hypothetical protein n=1 Tax=Streptococcus infantis TaxID=68892 RepID=UPI0039C19913